MSGIAHAALAVALLAGGSGEPDDKSNFFLKDFSDFKQALSSRGWKVEVVAGAGKRAAKAASNAELLATTERTLERADSADKVLLIYHSHGLRQRTDWGQKSHSITSEDRDGAGNTPAFDLDRIEPALKKAASRGVKVALVDLSCYSGATLALQGPVCTISLASKKYVSLCSGRPEERLFASRFLKLPSGYKPSLEEQFLEARREDLGSVNLPQISSRKTPAVDAWDEFLESVDPLDTYEDLQELRAGAKPFDSRKLLDAIRKSPVGFKESLSSVVAERAKLEAAMPALTKDYDEAELSFDLPSGEKLNLPAASLAELLDASASGKVPPEWDDVQRHRLEQIAPLRAALEARFRQKLSAFRERRKAFDQLTTVLELDTGAVLSFERKIYDERSEPVANGCRDFTL